MILKRIISTYFDSKNPWKINEQIREKQNRMDKTVRTISYILSFFARERETEPGVLAGQSTLYDLISASVFVLNLLHV